MKFTHMMMAVASLALSVTPALAAPAGNPAASLSIGNARAATVSGHKSKLAGGGTIIAIIAVIAVIGGIIAVSSHSDKPASA